MGTRPQSAKTAQFDTFLFNTKKSFTTVSMYNFNTYRVTYANHYKSITRVIISGQLIKCLTN